MECGAKYKPTEPFYRGISLNDLTRDQLNDPTRDLILTKESAQLLGSRLRENNLLALSTTYFWFRNRDEKFRKYFNYDGDHFLEFCQDISGVISSLVIVYISAQWRLFLDSSVKSLKAILLHNGNNISSVPVGHSVKPSECYKDMKLLLESIKHSQCSWKICGDLKMILVVLGLLTGYTKHACFCVHGTQGQMIVITYKLAGRLEQVLHLLLKISNLLS